MRLANQNEIDAFLAEAYTDPGIYPYLTVCQYTAEHTAIRSDWEKVVLINDSGTCLLIVRIDRTCENEFSISVWSRNSFAAGRCVKVVKELVRRYNPRAINSIVHASNEKSIRFNTRLLGEPWGREPKGAWNGERGEWEDLLHFKLNIR